MSDGDGGQQRMVERAIEGEAELDARLAAEHHHCEAAVARIGFLDEDGWVSVKEDRLVKLVSDERADALGDGLEMAAQVVEMCMRANTVTALAAAIRALKPRISPNEPASAPGVDSK